MRASTNRFPTGPALMTAKPAASLTSAIVGLEDKIAAVNRKEIARIRELARLQKSWNESVFNSIDMLCKSRVEQRQKVLNKLSQASFQAARDAILVRRIALRIVEETRSIESLTTHLSYNGRTTSG